MGYIEYISRYTGASSTQDDNINLPSITDLYYKDPTLLLSLKSRQNCTLDKGGKNERWWNAQRAKYGRLLQEYVVLLQLFEKIYTYECINTVLIILCR
jgi:hypothetical protein